MVKISNCVPDTCSCILLVFCILYVLCSRFRHAAAKCKLYSCHLICYIVCTADTARHAATCKLYSCYLVFCMYSRCSSSIY